MNSFIQSKQIAITNYFNSVINVTNDIQACLGCLTPAPLPKIQRCVVISPKELYDLANTLRENEASIMSSEDTLVKILNQLGPLHVTNEDKVLSVSRQPLLLKVPLWVEHGDIIEVESSVVTAKMKLRKLLVTETLFEGIQPSDQDLIHLLKNLSIEALDTKTLVEEALIDLNQLPGAYKDNNFHKLFDEIETVRYILTCSLTSAKEHWTHVKVHEGLQMDKIELLQAIEQHKKDVTDLTDMKIMH
jgi:hypothetical protein